MIKSGKHQLVTVLLLVCTCGLTLGAEPNEAETGLKFEIRNDRPSPMLLRTRNFEPSYGSTHCAVLFIFGDWGRLPTKSVDAILATSAGRAMSQKQRDLVSTLPFRHIDFGGTIGNHTYFRLDGVSEDNTKKMVEAFIEILTEKADARMQSSLNQQQELQEKIAEIKKELPEKKKQFKAAELKYKEIKNTRYFPDNPNETYRKAMETVFQMDKTLDTLEIELAGIRDKLKKIVKYRQNKYAADAKHFSRETLDKLDQMYVEQMIDLSSAKARQEAALKIRNREKEFLNLFSQWSNLDNEVKRLKQDLVMYENNLWIAEKKLANPTPDMLPPKVYQNKVTIYPVK